MDPVVRNDIDESGRGDGTGLCTYGKGRLPDRGSRNPRLQRSRRSVVEGRKGVTGVSNGTSMLGPLWLSSRGTRPSPTRPGWRGASTCRGTCRTVVSALDVLLSSFVPLQQNRSRIGSLLSVDDTRVNRVRDTDP